MYSLRHTPRRVVDFWVCSSGLSAEATMIIWSTIQHVRTSEGLVRAGIGLTLRVIAYGPRMCAFASSTEDLRNDISSRLTLNIYRYRLTRSGLCTSQPTARRLRSPFRTGSVQRGDQVGSGHVQRRLRCQCSGSGQGCFLRDRVSKHIAMVS